MAVPASALFTRGNALAFDGADDYVQSQQDVVLSNRSFSVEAWVQRRSSDTMDLVVGQGWGAPNQCLIFGFHCYAGNQFLFGLLRPIPWKATRRKTAPCQGARGTGS